MSSETDLPEGKFCSNFQLFNPSIKIELTGFRGSQIRTISLVTIFVQVCKMVSNDLTQPTELSGSFILLAKLKSFVRSHLHIEKFKITGRLAGEKHLVDNNKKQKVNNSSYRNQIVASEKLGRAQKNQKQ